MNPITNHPPPPQTLSTCPRHLDNNTFSGICPSCLSQRLSITNLNLNKQSHEQQQHLTNMSDLENDILEMESQIDSLVHSLKSINHHIDFVHLSSPSPSPSKKSNFWSTSAWTKKWQHWRRKHKLHNKTTNDIVSETKLPAPSHDTDYVFGRRSCDMGPRFSLDAGRVSGSWDGYLVGRSFPKLGDENIPGGETQTREYYLNRRRIKGLERSNSLVDDNSVLISNAKVSPEYYNHNHNHIHNQKQRRIKFHSIGGEKELAAGDDGLVKKPKWWNWKGKVWGNQINSKNGEFDRKLSRSNSSVSWRNMVESVTNKNKCQGDEFVTEKSPNHASSGLLRFYLTPLRGSRRSATETGSSKSKISSKG